MTNKEKIAEALLKNKQLSDSTLKTYVSLLYNLKKQMNDLEDDMDFFAKKKDAIIEFVSKKPSQQSQKTIYSGLYILTNLPEYKDRMNEMVKQVNDHYAQRRVDEKRQPKQLSFEDVKAIHEKIKSTYVKNKSIYNMMNYLISSLCSGVMIAPRRLEYCDVKIANYDEEKDNFVKGNKIYFNKYKTAGKYGMQSIDIPKELTPIINKLKKENLCDYLMVTTQGTKFSNSALNKRLTLLFGCGIDILRSVYLSDHIYSNDLLKKLEETAAQMGNSVEAQMAFYVKDK